MEISDPTHSSRESCKKYLHDYFNKAARETDKICVIFDDGINIEKLTYLEVDSLASRIAAVLRQTTDGHGFIGVIHQANHIFPSVQLGVLQSGCAYFNMRTRNWNKMLEAARRILKVKFLLISEKVWNENQSHLCPFLDSKQEIKVIIGQKFLGVLYLIKLKEAPENEIPTFKPFQYAYAMQTSGTTGNKKFVLVPHHCITPNIQDFITRVWKLNGNDVLWGSSPSTFDPSVCDLFCALGVGGTILYTDEMLKDDGVRLGAILMKHQVSVIQTTPSLFTKLGKDLKASGLFTPGCSSLKVLALGGERCPSKEELRVLINEEFYQTMRAFINLYGVTEMSCWASFGSINPYNTDPLCVGQPLNETWITKHKENENTEYSQVILESASRICTIIDENGTILQDSSQIGQEALNRHQLCTGDLAIVHEKFGIEVIGRLDNMVKRRGMKVPLQLIEDMAMQTGILQIAHATEYKDKIYLIVVPIDCDNSSLGLEKHVKANFFPYLKLDLHPEFYPNAIIAVQVLDVTENGKIDVSGILKIAKSQPLTVGEYHVQENTIKNVLHSLWLIATGRRSSDTPLESVGLERFYDFGGTSATAMWLLESFFSSLHLYGSPVFTDLQEELFKKLAVETFEGLSHFISVELDKKPMNAKLAVITAEQVTSQKHKNSKSVLQLSEPAFGSLWGQSQRGCVEEVCAIDHSVDFNPVAGPDKEDKILSPIHEVMSYEYDLNMCVDAAPVISSNDVVIVGSHSGTMIAVDTGQLRAENKKKLPEKRNAVLWTRIFPERLEADAVFSEDGCYVFVGCHDKMLYKISVVDGGIVSTYMCGGAIRTKVAINSDNSKVVVVDNENGLYCLSSTDLQFMWKTSLKISPTSHPVIAGNFVIVTTEAGVAGYCIDNGNKVWPLVDKSNKVCTSPVVWNSEKFGQVVVGGTQAGFEIRDCATGNRVCSWRETDVKTTFYTPIIHKCNLRNKLAEIILTSAEGTGLRAQFSDAGMDVQRFSIQDLTTAPAIICTKSKTSQETNNCTTCYLLSKPRTSNHFIFYDLEDPSQKLVFESYQSDQQNFSRPLSYKDMIIFGGRDNKLHITYCSTISIDSDL